MYKDIDEPSTTSCEIADGEDETTNSSSYKSTANDVRETNNRWEHKAILMLIEQYKRSLSMFTSTSVRNDVAWKAVSEKLYENGFTFNSTQCEYKFKNLKRQYQKKIDSMRNTGAAAVKFDYFSQFDEIFGTKPNITPIAVASSRREQQTETADSEDALEEKSNVNESKDNIQNKISKRKTKADRFLGHMEHLEKEKEEAKRKRHEELVALQREAINVFAQKMDKLIDKL